jgi:anthranilate phosphoribosyltransferase
VVHGTANASGMDELSTLGRNAICELRDGALAEFDVDPAALGFGPAALADLTGGDAAENAALVGGILACTVQGPKRDIAVLNAAAGFVITGLAEDLAGGCALAQAVLDCGAAHAKMRALRDWC